MVRVKDLQMLAATLSPEEFGAQLGPFMLIQQPDAPVLAQVASRLGGSRTIAMAHRGRLGDQVLEMLRGFASLWVHNFPGLRDGQTLTVGRVPECEICIEEPSVSKKHATLRWDAARNGCAIRDLRSTNGTFVNARALGDVEEVELWDGDAISFGDAQFIYMLAPTLHGQFRTLRGER